MTKTKAPGAVVILFAAIAAPAFARPGPTHHGRAHDRWSHRATHARPVYATPRVPEGRNIEYNFRGRDPSWIGGRDSSLAPPPT
jgi:hypothetical protein